MVSGGSARANEHCIFNPHSIYLLYTLHRNLRNYITKLEKKLKDDERSQISKKDCMRKVLQGSSMLGPTQIKCLANDSTKGRGWTNEEKAKALLLKKMCNQVIPS